MWVHMTQPLLQQAYLVQHAQEHIQAAYEDSRRGDPTASLGNLYQCSVT